MCTHLHLSLKMYRSEKIKNIDIKFNDFVAVKLFIRTIKQGSNVVDFPATFKH